MRIISLLFVVVFLIGCEKQSIAKTPQMEEEARATVVAYLEKNSLSLEGLKPFDSSASPKPDFGFLYTGGGHCIEFIVNCHGGRCTDWAKYPYDEHGEKCP